MAKPNYAFAKRQRDLAKKAKKEEKRLRKIAEGGESGEAGEADGTAAEDTPPDAAGQDVEAGIEPTSDPAPAADK